MADNPTSDTENRIKEKLEQFRQITREHEQKQTEGGIGFNPGDDPIAQEAIFRLIEETIDQSLARTPDQVVDPEEVKRFKQEFRQKAQEMRARNRVR